MKLKEGILKKVLIALVVIFGIIVAFDGFYKVDPGHRGVMIVLGKVKPYSLPNGVGLKWPLISDVVQVNIQTNTFDMPATTYTNDVQSSELNFSFIYSLNPENVHKLYEEVGMGYHGVLITPRVEGVLKNVIGKWQAQDLVGNRDEARQQVLEQLSERIDMTYFSTFTVEFKDVEYSDDFEKAIENKVIAEQRAQEAVNNTKRITEEANQKLISAKADAEAMEIKSEALAKNKGLTEYEAVQKWDGKLPQYMLGNAVPFVNIPSK